MRNQAMTIPGANWWGTAELAITERTNRIVRLNLGRRLCESVLLMGVVVLMSAFTVGTIVLLACTVAQTAAGAR